MKPVKALMALGLLLIMTQAAAEPVRVGKTGGWVIFQNADGTGECFAGATYEGDDSFIIGLTAPNRDWYFGFHNPAWQSIVPGQTYELKYVFNGRRQWSGPSTGQTNTLRSGSLKEGFVMEIANSSSMRISYAGRKLGSYSLRGTRAAVLAVIQCYERHFNKQDPFAKADPFASGKSGSKDPFAK